ncbi:Fc.00g035180.m01.CDS01 [Cosmosporella sp. VM-42]
MPRQSVGFFDALALQLATPEQRKVIGAKWRAEFNDSSSSSRHASHRSSGKSSSSKSHGSRKHRSHAEKMEPVAEEQACLPQYADYSEHPESLQYSEHSQHSQYSHHWQQPVPSQNSQYSQRSDSPQYPVPLPYSEPQQYSQRSMSDKQMVQYQPLSGEDQDVLEFMSVPYHETRPDTPPLASAYLEHPSRSSRTSSSSKPSHSRSSRSSHSQPTGITSFFSKLGQPKLEHKPSKSSRSSHSHHSKPSRSSGSRHSGSHHSGSRHSSSRYSGSHHSGSRHSGSHHSSRSTMTIDSRQRMSYDPASDPLYAHIPREPGQHYPGEVLIHRPTTDSERMEFYNPNPPTSHAAYSNPFGDEHGEQYPSGGESSGDEYDAGYHSATEAASNHQSFDGIDDETVVPDDSVSRVCFRENMLAENIRVENERLYYASQGRFGVPPQSRQ